MANRSIQTEKVGDMVVGQKVIAKLSSGVCSVGERGVVYEVYERGWRLRDQVQEHGVSVIFEKGRHDGSCLLISLSCRSPCKVKAHPSSLPGSLMFPLPLGGHVLCDVTFMTR